MLKPEFTIEEGTAILNGIDTAIKLNITDTLSNVNSVFMDLQAGGVTKYYFRKDGVATFASTFTTSAGNIVAASDVYTGAGGYHIVTNRVLMGGSASGVMIVANTAITGFTRLQLGTTTAESPALGRVLVTGGWGITFPSAADTNGQATGFESVTELTTIAAAATTDTAILIPANVVVLGVSVRVTTVIPTAATFTVIGANSSTAFQTGASVSTAATTTDAGTKSCPFLNTTSQAIRITPDLTPANNSGRVRVTIHYYKITPPTS